MTSTVTAADQLQAARHKLAELRSVAEAADGKVRQSKIDLCLLRKSSEVRTPEVAYIEGRLVAERTIAANASKDICEQQAVVAVLESQETYERQQKLLADLRPVSARLIEEQDRLVEIAEEVVSKLKAAGEGVSVAELFPTCVGAEATLRHDVMRIALRLQNYMQRQNGGAEGVSI